MSISCVSALVQGVDYNKNRTDDVQIFKRFEDEGFKECGIVTGTNSKRGVAFKNPSKRGLERRVAVGKIVSQRREQVVILAFGSLLPQKNEGRCKTVHFLEATRDLVCDGRLSGARLSEQNKTTLRVGTVHPINDEVQEGCARSRKAAFLRHEARACPIRYFSDFCVYLCDNY